LLRSAYDESRPELQQLWTELIAAAMDPNRSGRVRLSFIDTLKRFDPLDALLLRARFDQPSELLPNAMEFFAHFLNKPRDEILLSVENLESLRCVASVAHNRQNFTITVFGRGLISVCVD
jgi:Abortive infection alpha